MNYYNPTTISQKIAKIIQLFIHYVSFKFRRRVVELKSRSHSVLMVVPTADRVGGYENQAKQLAAALAADGYLITILTDRIDDSVEREFLDGYLIHRIPKQLFSFARYFWQHRKTFDLVHAHGVTGFSIIFIRLARFFGLPVLLKPATAADLHTIFKSYGLKDKLYQSWLKQLDIYVAISDELKTEILSCGIDPEKIRRIPNFVDTSRFVPATAEQRRRIKQELQIPADHKLFLFVGRLVQRKGVDVLLPSWKEVANATLFIVGDGPERHALEHSAESLQLKNVQFRGAASNTLPYYQAADFFVLPSLSEGLPGVLLEALSCGVPCIATEIGGVSDVLKDGNHGILIKPASKSELSSAFQSAISNDQTEQWRLNCRKTAEQYDIRKISAIYQQLYASLTKT